MKFIVIGISDHSQPFFSPDVAEIIRQGKVFSGGRRHHHIVAKFLPIGAEWIDISVPLDAVFEKYACAFPKDRAEQASLIVFASGDPLFFGFANTIKRKMPHAEILLYPTFNSLQTLAHRLLLPYHDMRVVSLTGRPWPEFDRALIERVSKIGVLTDREHSPQAIARRMLAYGYSQYIMSVGEHLGNPDQEKITTLSLLEATEVEFAQPNCLILHAKPDDMKLARNSHSARFGIPDDQFALLHGREKMITKMPIRLLTLQALDLPRRQVLWDIGFCTGSISIEARLQFPHLHIEAFEIRPEGRELMHVNSQRFGAPGIGVHIGDFLDADISELPRPDAVFIGGHGGRLKAIIGRVLTILSEGGCIVMNSVSAQSRQLWQVACDDFGLQQEAPMRIALNDYNPITILKGVKHENSHHTD